ncbi:RnfH family protein [Thalassotalea maritima]|uniref:RnfH family protein n=1 Tax=Thalassotalea maritima TaxID=3242416 RepID=UPI003529CC38
MSSEQISIELVYALPSEQTLLSLLVDQGATVEQAIQESGICAQYPEIDLKVNKVGIWNRAVKLSQVVEDGDRIEIYRPLIADPKEVRKRRAEKAKLEGRADKVTGGRVNPLRSGSDKDA